MQTIPRTPKAPFFGAQTTLDLFAAPAVPARRRRSPVSQSETKPEAAPAATAADAVPALNLTPEPPFSIAADHYAALAKKA